MGIKKHIPNTITALNLLCGCLGVVAAMLGHVEQAFLLMIAGAVFDFFDGFVARLLGVSSAMGKELDSIADTVSFGLLPAIMMCLTLSAQTGIDNPISWIPIIIAVFSGLRLAKFNIDTRQTSSFLGLPTPACAMICGSLAYFCAAAECDASILDIIIAQSISNVWVIIPLSVVLSLLLVSEIPMFSLKMHKGDKIGGARISFVCVAVAAIIASAMLGINLAFSIFITFIAYILINIIWLRR